MNPRTIDTKYEGKTSTGEKAELHVPVRALWQSETTAYHIALNEHNDKPDNEKDALQYTVRLDTLASWITGMPFIRTFTLAKGGKKESHKDKFLSASMSPEAAFRDLFKEVSPSNDWKLESLITSAIGNSILGDPLFP